MSVGQEIDYEALINRSIRNFRPTRRLWSPAARLGCWILFEAAILSLALWARGFGTIAALLPDSAQLIAAGLFVSASTATAFLALKSAIPGREVSWPQAIIVFALVAAAFASEPSGRPSEIMGAAPILTLQVPALATLPWLCLFWAVRRGVPLQPAVSGAAVGLAAFCLAAALCPIIARPSAVPCFRLILALDCGVVIVLSTLAGRFWLYWIGHWQREEVATEIFSERWGAFGARAVFPLALSAATAVFILVLLKGPGPHIGPIPEFDLAIDSYERALTGFRPNVPSTSMETMLTAYVERGMPAYMWDFGPEGFKLAGGRWDPLPDGTPVTYTWFRGAKGGVMCIFRQTEAFNPPLMVHDEHHHLLFYRYHHFSFCLINVGGYGNFVSIIAAPMPLKQFEHLVLAATL
jgi:hypothetical protein